MRKSFASTVALLAFFLTACGGSDDSGAKPATEQNFNYNGFLNSAAGFSPLSLSYQGNRPPLALDRPTGKVVIVYNHGTASPQKPENCSQSGNRAPSSLTELQGAGLVIYYLCGQSYESGSTWGNAGSYVYKRMNEVRAVLDELIAAGVEPANIFLSGHSAGGWVSLMSARYFPEKFNAVIAFAPAFAGKRSEESVYPWWLKEVRPAQIKDLTQAPVIKALVFAYPDDPYERPEDLQYLSDQYPATVSMVSNSCNLGNPHMQHLNDCHVAQTQQQIVQYLEKMLGRRL